MADEEWVKRTAIKGAELCCKGTIVSTKDPGRPLENRRAELTELPVGKSSE